jgi:hypothetical protein
VSYQHVNRWGDTVAELLDTAAAVASATVEDLVSQLGPELVEVILAPPGALTARAHDVVIMDTAEELAVHAGDVVLAIGVSPHVAGPAVDILRSLGQLGAAALVVKTASDQPVATEVLDAAHVAGLALLGIPRCAAWGHVYHLVRATTTAPPSKGDGSSGVGAGDLFALADAVASAAGGPVTIEDPQSRVLAFSNLGHPIDPGRRDTILGRRVPDPWLKRLGDAGVFRRLWKSDDVVRADFPSGDASPRRAIAVKAGAMILGQIWIAESELPLHDDTDAILREAARIAAIHMLRSSVVTDIQRRSRADALKLLLRGEGPGEALASDLGMQAGTGFVVVAFQVVTDEPMVPVLLDQERLLSMITVYFESFRQGAISTTYHDRIYTLIPARSDPGREFLRNLVSKVLARASESLRLDVLAGIGSAVAAASGIPRSREQADQVLRVLLAAPERGGRSATIEEVQGRALLLEFDDFLEQRPHVRSQLLNELRRYDEKNAADFVDTLRVYLGYLGDVSLAARDLNVHANTIRYRLRRMRAIWGINFEDQEERLALELQLRLNNHQR